MARASPAVADAQLLLKLMGDILFRNGTERQKKKYLRVSFQKPGQPRKGAISRPILAAPIGSPPGSLPTL